MYNVWSLRSSLSAAGLLALLLLGAALPSRAQDRNTRYVVERAEVGVSGKIIEERGGDWASVTFDRTRAQTSPQTERLTRVRGVGRHAPPDGPARDFIYEALVDWRNGKIESVSYNMAGGGVRRPPGRDDRRVPRWLVGTFYGRSPSSNHRRVTLTVTRDGDATALYDDGASEQGTYGNGRIRFSASDTWDVSRVEEGVRAASGRRSEVLTIYTSGGGYGDDNDDDDNEGGRVPRWLRGTFRGTTDSGESELTVRADGTATARSLTKNQSFRGTYANGRLRFEWGAFDVERTRDGIRTIEVNNRNNQTEYRRAGDN